MTVNNFKILLNNCRNFVNKMNRDNIPKDIQKVMLRAYITGYSDNQGIKINPTEYNITELVA